MSKTPVPPPSSEEISQHLLGETTRARSEEIEADPRASKELELQRGIIKSLEAGAPELEKVDLLAGVHAELARDAPSTPSVPARRVRAPFIHAAIAAVVASAAAVLLATNTNFERAGEFRARSGASTPAERFAGITVFTADRDRVKGRLGPTMRAGDGLLVAYENGGATPFRFLMVFAVDGAGEIFWLYPEHSSEGRDPTSIAIEPTKAAVELPDRITHDFKPGSLAIYGLFTRRALGVSAVERKLGAGWDPLHPAKLGFEDTAEQVINVTVESAK